MFIADKRKIFHPAGLLLSGLLVLLTCGAWGVSVGQEYLLGEGDVLNISVYEHADLTSRVRVSGDGMISMPLLGQVRAGDLTVKQLEEEVIRRLADGYILEPQVSIFVEEFRSRKVTILGQVRRPGVYEIQGQTNILELISKADGLTGDADYRAIVQSSDPRDEERPVTVVDLAQLMQEGRSSQNIRISDGDHVYIPQKDVFYVSGQVKKPDVYHYEPGLTVIKALTMAGGPSDKAAPDRTRIIRNRDGQEELIRNVAMDMPVMPNDVIVVPESYF